MAKRFSKSTETRDELQLPAILCQDACQCLMLDPLPSFNWWAVSLGGEKLKWRQLTHHQLMSQLRPHLSPTSNAKANYKSTNLRKIVNWR